VVPKGDNRVKFRTGIVRFDAAHPLRAETRAEVARLARQARRGQAVVAADRAIGKRVATAGDDREHRELPADSVSLNPEEH